MASNHPFYTVLPRTRIWVKVYLAACLFSVAVPLLMWIAGARFEGMLGGVLFLSILTWTLLLQVALVAVSAFVTAWLIFGFAPALFNESFNQKYLRVVEKIFLKPEVTADENKTRG